MSEAFIFFIWSIVRIDNGKFGTLPILGIPIVILIFSVVSVIGVIFIHYNDEGFHKTFIFMILNEIFNFSFIWGTSFLMLMMKKDLVTSNTINLTYQIPKNENKIELKQIESEYNQAPQFNGMKIFEESTDKIDDDIENNSNMINNNNSDDENCNDDEKEYYSVSEMNNESQKDKKSMEENDSFSSNSDKEDKEEKILEEH